MVLSHILRRILEHWLQMDRLHLQQVNLLITEEGWGLSSANWLIKHSAWSVKFLHDALTAAHVELQLFGDQDAMILHLMNRIFFAAKSKVLSSKFSKVSVLINFLCFHLSKPTENVYIYIYLFHFPLSFYCWTPLADNQTDLPKYGSQGQSLEAAQRPPEGKDPLDRHAAIIPQFELNAYDALNALTMECDAFVEGDLLVTFPQCKDAEGCDLDVISGRCFVVKVAVAFTYWVVVEKLAHSLKISGGNI